MALKAVTYQFKGMNRDLSNINANELFAYEIRNMKITPDNDNTLLSISNIKGHKDTNIKLTGTPIGHAVIDNQWIIFCAGTSGVSKTGVISEDTSIEDTGNLNPPQSTIPEIDVGNRDYIYMLTKEEDSFLVDYVYGNLGFSTKHPIETITYVENQEILKIYWTDGINQLRFITTEKIKNSDRITTADIDFIPKITDSKEVLSVEKVYNSSGAFPAGTVQYAFSYVNYYGQLSNIFKISSIYYSTDEEKSLSVERTSSNGFKIVLKKLNNKMFNYLRIYSIVRTSADTVPEVRLVDDINIDGKDTITYIDRHTTGLIVDPTDLFFIGGELLVVNTMCQKDNTLFVGNVKKIMNIIPKDLTDKLKIDNSIEFYNDDNKIINENASGKLYEELYQLNYSSEQITTFKYDDYYRFGILFLHNSGKWSDPYRITDAKNDKHLISELSEDFNGHTHKLVSAKFDLNNLSEDTISQLRDLGYIKARPVIVYPTFYDRHVLCLGYLSPTVYNAGERLNNGAFALSSWFARPWFKGNFTENNNEDSLGAILEFRHNHTLTGIYTAHLELQSSYDGYYEEDSTNKISCAILNSEDPYNEINFWEKGHALHFFVDNSIVTMHSPDIEFDDSFKTTNLDLYKLRIVGYVPLTGFQGDSDIITSSIYRSFEECETWAKDKEDNGGLDLKIVDIVNGNNGYDKLGFYKNIRSKTNYSELGNRILCSGVFYRDSYVYQDQVEGGRLDLPLFKDDIFQTYTGYYNTLYPSSWNPITGNGFDYRMYNLISACGYNIFPFHANGSISNIDNRSVLQYKKLSNVRYSYGNVYKLNYELNTYSKRIFYSDLDSLLPIKTYNNEEVFYKGNIDTIITGKLRYTDVNSEIDYNNGVSIFASPQLAISYTGKTIEYNGDTMPIYEFKTLTALESTRIPQSRQNIASSTQPIVMRYKSTPHIVLSLKSEELNTLQVLPLVNTSNKSSSWISNLYNHKKCHMFWQDNEDPDKILYYKEDFSYLKPEDTKFSGLWLAELYLDFTEDFILNSLFGGNLESSSVNNNWVVAGKDVDLNVKNSLIYKEGDTYYQRYNNLKTYPWSLEEVNGITDVISFMVETKINLNGRYDNNNPIKPHFHIFPDNFNVINKGYSQKNNFFSYYSSNQNTKLINQYPNLVSWSKTKTPGELVDTWLNLNLSSTLELDGNSGKINALCNHNNYIVAFQDSAINYVLYNELYQISTQQGVPVEIANSGKVTGYRNLSNNIGCTNKWSICKTSNGLYFLDGYNKNLYKLGEGFDNISNTLGFDSYIKGIKTVDKVWNNNENNSIKTSYDPINKEVLFSVQKEDDSFESLAYSEQLNTFTSFYDFKTTYLATLQGNSFILGTSEKGDLGNETSVYEYQKGDYTYFEGVKKPYYIEFISNPNPLNDKIFNTLEFRSDSYLSNGELQNFKTFDKLTVSNEYQSNSADLKYTNYGLSTLKKKFRIWKALIPRDKVKYDRIRNTWTKIKLESTENNDDLNTVLHDITVHYSM